MSKQTNLCPKQKFVEVSFDAFEEATTCRSLIKATFKHGMYFNKVTLGVEYRKSPTDEIFSLVASNEAAGDYNQAKCSDIKI